MEMQDIEVFENNSDEEYLPRDLEFDSYDSDILQDDDSDDDFIATSIFYEQVLRLRILAVFKHSKPI